MRINTFLLLNAFGLMTAKKTPEPEAEPHRHHGSHNHTESGEPRDEHPRKESLRGAAPESTNSTNTTESDEVPDWTQYTEGDRADWMKYMNKPGSGGQGSDGQFDWMKFAGPYMNQYTQPQGGNEPSSNESTNASWNNGQGDGFGEPFRSQTGGDFRYKMGREWNQSQGGWQQYAAAYNSVNPQQPGNDGSPQGTPASQGGNMDWQKYTGGSQGQGGKGGNMDWQKYMGGSQGGVGGNMDWQKYMGQGQGGQGNMDWQKYTSGSQGQGNMDWQKYMGQGQGGQVGPQPGNEDNKVDPSVKTSNPQSGGYFELEVSGKDLNVTTNFGLGQGHGGNSTKEATGGGGGGGGNQNSITAKEGRIFIRGQFRTSLWAKM